MRRHDALIPLTHDHHHALAQTRRMRTCAESGDDQACQWMAGKAIDTFAPCGPALVLLDEVDDVQRLGVRARVNGRTMQDGTTAQMIFSVATARCATPWSPSERRGRRTLATRPSWPARRSSGHSHRTRRPARRRPGDVNRPRRADVRPAARCPGRLDRISETKLNRSGTRQIGRRRRDVKAWRRDGLRGGLHSDTLTERLELADKISLARFRVVATVEVVSAEVLVVAVI